MATPKKGYRYQNEVIPGTTTIISRFKDSGALMYWAHQQGAAGKPLRGQDSEVEQAAQIGTAAHEMIEAHINKKSPKIALNKRLKEERHKQKARTAFESYLNWEKQTGLTMLSKFQEIQLISPMYRYGGTPDAIGEIDGEIALLDWKTSNGVYADYAIQLAAYQHLVNYGIRMDNGEKLPFLVGTRAHLLRFSKESADFHHHSFNDLSEEMEQFLLFREAFDHDKTIKKRV